MAHGSWIRSVAMVLLVALPCPVLPTLAEPPMATVSGFVQLAGDHSPLAGAKVFAGDPKTGKVYPSDASTLEGRFKLAEIPAATYQLAVGIGESLYVVDAPIRLAPGEEQRIHLAVEPVDSDAGVVPKKSKKNMPSLWSNPLTAALIVIGGAIVTGVLVEGATDDDDEPQASPF